MKRYDIGIIGGGIVGVAAAFHVKQRFPHLSMLIVEKEARLAAHQSGHNSGVIHAGVYYQPGSLKADFCRRGLRATYDFCREYGLPARQCGKLLVATDERELERMEALETRCRTNRIAVQRLNGAELREVEPHVTGVGALLVEATGITDYRLITEVMAQRYLDLGGEIRFGAPIRAMDEQPERVRLACANDYLEASHILVCGGLMADRLARMVGCPIDFRIIPFRGEYYRLPPVYSSRLKHLIYPIPDPELPFLGIHLTKMINGETTVGPNAVLGWKREGYGRFNVSVKDTVDTLVFPGSWRLFARYASSGLAEIRDSLYKSGYLKRVRTYCPGVQLADLLPYPAGIRAQAVLRDGTLVHDFLFKQTERTLHVCNAPSPAATSALPIGEYLSDKAAEMFRL